MTDQTATVARIRAQYPTPLGAQHAACLVAIAQAIGQGAGLLRKDTGTHITLPDGTNVSQDIIAFPTGQIYDVLGDAEGEARPGWSDAGMVDALRYVAVPAAPGPHEPPQPPQTPDLSGILARLTALEAQVTRLGEAVVFAQQIADAAANAVAALPQQEAGAKHGDPVSVTGKMSLSDVANNRTVTWTGKIL